MIERTKIQNHEHWLALRMRDVTASDIGALFGDHPYRTMLGLYQEKSTGIAPDFDSGVMRRGRLLEDAVRRAMEEEHPDWVITKDDAYYSDRDARIGATPDYLVGLKGNTRKQVNMQVKTVAPNIFAKRWTDDSPPLHVVLQTMTEMMLTGMNSGCVAALVIDPYNLPLKEYAIPRDERVERKLKTAVEDFWGRIADNNPPAADYQRDGALIASLYPVEVADKSIDLTRDNRVLEIISERERLASAIKPLEEERKGLDVELKEKLGDSEVGIARGYKVTLKTRKGYTATVNPSRVLRVLQMKEG